MNGIPEEAALFAAGDTVMHPSEGVCRVEDVRAMRFPPQPERRYYVLRPSQDKGSASAVVYLPVARGNAVLRRLLSVRDIDALIRESRALPSLWIEDTKLRKEAFQQVLRGGDYARVIRMITEIREYGEARAAAGKKPCAGDEAIREEAERLLHEEFSCVLGLSRADTVAYIRRRLGV